MAVDPMLLGSVSVVLGFILFVIFNIIRLHRSEKEASNRVEKIRTRGWGEEENQGEDEGQRRGPVVVGGMRRAAVRRRGPTLAERREGGEGFNPRMYDEDGNEDSMEEEDGEASGYRHDILMQDGKVGKKKMRKLEQKAEKRAQAEADRVEREERKEREKEREEKRKEEEEKEKAEEAAREEEERKKKEEQEQREYEEYLKLKESFAVEEEGYDENQTLESENMLQDFILYIKQMKVVNMDELASHFKLKTKDVVERVKTLVDEKTLTGVIDDRGKFICITEEELLAVAKFINQRGRVSIQELAEYSNRLIRLEPEEIHAK